MIVHLSGSRRGTTQRLSGTRLLIGSAPDCDVRLADDVDPPPPRYAASLIHREDTYELHVEAGESVWVNGDPVKVSILESGDLLEIGNEGPVLRFRLYDRGSLAHKSVPEVFKDCLDWARYGSDSTLGRARILLGGITRELGTQTSRHFRGTVVALLAVLILATGLLAWRSFQLEQRLETQITQVGGLAELLERSGPAELTNEDLTEVLAEIQDSLSDTRRRIHEMETGTGIGARVVAAASRATVFLQGSFSFEEAETGWPLRLVLGPGGRPLANSRGEPAITVSGEGPILEVFFTGTAFVVDPGGILLSNRHVALPWDFDDAAQRVVDQGFTPVMRRFVGYLPGLAEGFDVQVVASSDEADLALLRCSEPVQRLPFLKLEPTPPVAGQEVIVLGYPLGIRALMARTDVAFVEELREEGDVDFWTVAERLSQEGHIAPLASRGIVGQVSASAVVYDAETTSGGSGGPVLNFRGQVVAINAAVIPEFGGSNLGVPAEWGRQLLEREERQPLSEPPRQNPSTRRPT